MGPNDPFYSDVREAEAQSYEQTPRSFQESREPLPPTNSRYAAIGFVAGVGLAVLLIVFGFGTTFVIILSGLAGSVIAIGFGRMVSGRLDIPAAWSALRGGFPDRSHF